MLFFDNYGEVNSVLSFGNDVFDSVELNLLILEIEVISGSNLTLRLLGSLGGLGFGLGNSSDDKPLFRADFKPLSSR